MTFTKEDFENFIETLNSVGEDFYCSEREIVSYFWGDFETFVKRKNKAQEELNAVAYPQSLGYTVTDN